MGALTKPIREYESMKRALTGLADSTVESYLTVMPAFCRFVGKDPDQIIAERKKQLRSDDEGVARTYERAVVRFYEHQKKHMSESAAYRYAASTVRGFFGRNYVGLKFRRGDMRAPKTENRDYIPTIGEVKEICDAADIRDKAVVILALQTGVAPVDLVGLKRSDFERALKSDEFPQSLGWLQRNKSRGDFHPFLFRDSAVALKRYLQTRKDNLEKLNAIRLLMKKKLKEDSPYLFVDRFYKQLQEHNVNDIFTKAAKRAGIVVPEGKRLRVYSLRSVFETQMGNAGLPQTWIDMMMGHVVGGARGKYVKPSEADWLEKVRKAEPFLAIFGKVEETEQLVERTKTLEGEIATILDSRAVQEREIKELKENQRIIASALMSVSKGPKGEFVVGIEKLTKLARRLGKS